MNTNHNSNSISCEEPITIVVSRRPKPGMESQLEDYITGISNDAMKQPGHLGTNVFRPETPDGSYKIIFKYDSFRNYQAWEKSDRREYWRKVASEVTEGEAEREILTGLESWFTLPGQTAVIPPPKHKMVIVIWLSIFPLITIISWVSNPFMEGFIMPLKTGILTAIAVPIMTYLVMPRMTKLFSVWLKK